MCIVYACVYIYMYYMLLKSIRIYLYNLLIFIQMNILFYQVFNFLFIFLYMYLILFVYLIIEIFKLY